MPGALQLLYADFTIQVTLTMKIHFCYVCYVMSRFVT